MHKFAWVLTLLCGAIAMPHPSTLTVRAFDQTGVPGNVLAGAEREANYVAEKGGFSIEWIDCSQYPDAFSAELLPGEVVIDAGGFSNRETRRNGPGGIGAGSHRRVRNNLLRTGSAYRVGEPSPAGKPIRLRDVTRIKAPDGAASRP
jgi:hypothetical protein